MIIDLNDELAVLRELESETPNAINTLSTKMIYLLADDLTARAHITLADNKGRGPVEFLVQPTGVFFDRYVIETACGIATERTGQKVRVIYTGTPTIPAYRWECHCSNKWETLRTDLPSRCPACRSTRWWADEPVGRGRPAK